MYPHRQSWLEKVIPTIETGSKCVLKGKGLLRESFVMPKLNTKRESLNTTVKQSKKVFLNIARKK